MNKIFSISLLLAFTLAFTGCVKSEEDDLFEKSAAERLNEASRIYSERLMASPHGWAMQLYPTTQDEYPYGSGYLLLMVFNKDYSVRVAMNNAFTTGQYKEDVSPWQVITDDGPVLSFNGHNDCLHAFSDPEDIPWTGDQDNTNDESGEGCGGDYEFIIVDAPSDASYMMLKGKKRGTYNLLTPVEIDDFEGYLNEINTFQSKMFPANYPSFDVIHFGEDLYKMEGADDGLPTIYPYNGDVVTESSFNPFLITKRGEDFFLRFRDAKTFDNGVTVQDFRYDPQKDVFESIDNADYYIAGSSPYLFFTEVIDGQQRRWEWNGSSMMSEAYAAKYNDVVTAFNGLVGYNNRPYNLSGMAWRVNNNILTLRFTYEYVERTGTKTGIADYNFDMERDGEGVTFKFLGDYTDGRSTVAQSVREALPAVQAMIDFMQQRFVFGGGETQFDLRQIRLISANDQNFWFIVSLT